MPEVINDVGFKSYIERHENGELLTGSHLIIYSECKSGIGMTFGEVLDNPYRISLADISCPVQENIGEKQKWKVQIE